MEPFSLTHPQTEIEGTFSRFEIPSLLMHAPRKATSGALRLVDGPAVRVIGFEAGMPTVAASSLAEERLGALLLERKVIDAAQSARIDALMLKDKVQFGAAAMSLGILTREVINEWLKEQHAIVVAHCLRMKTCRSTFGPLDKLPKTRSGLPFLKCIENGVREYTRADVSHLEEQLGTMRFVVPEGEHQRALHLGCTESLQQLLKMQAGKSKTYAEFIASSEDDEPTVPVLTLILCGLAVPEMGRPKSDVKPHATPAPAAAPAGAAGGAKMTDVDAFLSSLSKGPTPAPAAPVAHAAAPARTTGTHAAVPDLPDLPAAVEPVRRPATYTPAVAAKSTGFGTGAATSQPTPASASSPHPSTAAVHAFGGAGTKAPSPHAGVSAAIPQAHVQPQAHAQPQAHTPAQPQMQAQAPAGQVAVPGGAAGQAAMQYAQSLPTEIMTALARAQRPRSSLAGPLAGLGLFLVGGVTGAGLVLVLQMMRLVSPLTLQPGAAETAASAPAEASTARESGANEGGTATAAPSAPAHASEPSPASAAPAKEAPREAAKEPVKEAPAVKEPPPAREPPVAKERPAATAAKTKPPKPEPAKAEPAAAAPKAAGGDLAAKLAQVRKLLAASDHRQVIVVCTEILQLDPRNAAAYRSMGIAYSTLGARPQACESFRRYLRFAGDPPDKAQIEGLLATCK